MCTSSDAKKAIEAQYREYCNACESNHLERLTEFWALPAPFSVDFGESGTVHKLVETSSELQALYSQEFGPSTGVDKTNIETSDVRFFGKGLATIETTLQHFVKGTLHDKQHASYGCRKVDGKWMFISHVSEVIAAADSRGSGAK